MQGSVQKRNSEIVLWEMERPESRRPKKSGRKRRTAEADRMDRTIELIGLNDRVDRPVRRSRTAEPIRRNIRTAEPVRRNIRTAEPVRQNSRTAEPVRRNSRTTESARRRRLVEEDWDVELIGQDWVERPQRRKQTGQSKRRRKARKRHAYLSRTVAVCTMALCLLIAFLSADLLIDHIKKETAEKTVPVTKDVVLEDDRTQKINEPAILEDFLEVNDYSRPGTELPVVNSIFVHYTANPGTSARQNRSYFANLAETQERSASAHFIIGYEGEIVQCIPLDEQAYAVMTRNEDSISIECCYLEEDGEFTQETYDSLVQLLAWLKQKFHLGSDDILRHYDCGGKKCPLYYVEHEDAWEKLLRDVDTYIAEHGASQL